MLNQIYNDDKNRHKTLIVLLFCAVLCTCYIVFSLFYNNQYIKDINEFVKNFITNAITFVSICFGFYLTSLSILFSSKYIKTLNTEDTQKPTQRKIHTIREYFKLAIYCSLLTIITALLALSSFFLFSNKQIAIVIFSFFISFFVVNFLFIYFLLKLFMNALVIQARPDE